MVTLWGAVSAEELPPRWRVRASLIQGFGGSWHRGPVSEFPTSLELGVRLAGPISVVAAATGVVTGEYTDACGRVGAFLGHAGLRVDFNNQRSSSWIDPFLEGWGGVGWQAVCGKESVFPSAGVRGGLDVWLGRAAVTVAVGFDWTPVAPPAAAFLGATFLLY
jgi:hypothetical protein